MSVQSVSSRVMKESSAIRPRSAFMRILVALDFTDASRSLLEEAVALAVPAEAALSLVHVVEPVFGPPDVAMVSMSGELSEEAMSKRAVEQLRDFVTMLPPTCRVVETTVRCGIAFFEIAEAARMLDADLIVIGTHGRTGLKRTLMGSTAEKIVRHAPCPVLVMREKRSPTFL